jgi:RNA polymerase sigma-70 factor, ECF subfamily
VAEDPHAVTALLRAAQSGDRAASSALFEHLYAELRSRARQIGGQRGSTLQPTALVHEAWIKLVPNREAPFADRSHFLRAAARAMRSVLVDHLRAKKSQKRGGNALRVDLDGIADAYDARAIDLLALDEAMQRLTAVDPTLAELVELRFFAGLPMQEVADTMGVSLSSTERSWRLANAFLRAELADR